MLNPLHPIATEIDSPILFRTVKPDVYEQTLEHGSIWLRSDAYYRTIEDEARRDMGEGFSAGTTTVPLRLPFTSDDGQVHEMLLGGSGNAGQFLQPHYILSMHGSSITDTQREMFGGCTLGIRSPGQLAKELFESAEALVPVTEWVCAQVMYLRPAFTLTRIPLGGAPIQLGSNTFLSTCGRNVLWKDPVLPFIEQDEWRIVIFVNHYLNDDPMEPLKLKVDAVNFYPYLKSTKTVDHAVDGATRFGWIGSLVMSIFRLFNRARRFLQNS